MENVQDAEEFLTRCIQKSVNVYDFQNAIFLCERLVSLRRCTEHYLLFGDCYLKYQKPKKAYFIFKDAMKQAHASKESQTSALSMKLRFLYGLCCYKLQSYKEAENALLYGVINSHQPIRAGNDLPQSAESWNLLGKINREVNKMEKAIEFFMRAVKLEPFMWSAFEAICELGGNPEVEGLYDYRLIAERAALPESEPNDNFKYPFTPMDNCEFYPVESDISFLQTPSINNANSNLTTPPIHPNSSFDHFRLNPSFSTPPTTVTPNMPSAPVRNGWNLNNNPPVQLKPPNSLNSPDPIVALRPSRQALTNSNKSHKLKRPVQQAPRKKKFTAQDRVNMDSIPASMPSSSFEELCFLFQCMGHAYHKLCHFECEQAIQHLARIPKALAETGWVTAVLGRCYFELHQYHTAEMCFQKMRQHAPYRTDTLDYYSTTLWHLKQEVKLSVLGQQAHAIDKFCPETWIIIGNCFSLNKEHDNALKFFRRAIQVDDQCAYAYTLSAHEYAANEDFEKAIGGFRHAIRIDSRHYNAWFGLGNIFHRQERYDLSAEHYEKAVAINGHSAVIHCFLGITYFVNRQYEKALAKLTKAVNLAPSNPMARFHRGKVLMHMNQDEEALKELKEANTIDPTEVSVYYTLGELYKKLNQPGEALNMFSKALDVDPKHKKVIKQAMDSLCRKGDKEEDGDDF